MIGAAIAPFCPRSLVRIPAPWNWNTQDLLGIGCLRSTIIWRYFKRRLVPVSNSEPETPILDRTVAFSSIRSARHYQSLWKYKLCKHLFASKVSEAFWFVPLLVNGLCEELRLQVYKSQVLDNAWLEVNIAGFICTLWACRVNHKWMQSDVVIATWNIDAYILNIFLLTSEMWGLSNKVYSVNLGTKNGYTKLLSTSHLELCRLTFSMHSINLKKVWKISRNTLSTTHRGE